METIKYVTNNVCSNQIAITIEEDKIIDVKYIGGCNGNTQGISKLVAGMKIEEVINRLSGIRCGGRKTSCPDQLANALKLYVSDK